VTVTVTDSLGVPVTSSADVTINAVLSVWRFTVSPNSLDQGQNVTFTATPSGGTAPFAYAYAGLPAGCASTNTGMLHCRPTGSGNFAVGVTITDAFGQTAQGSTVLIVQPDPTITQFNATPATAVVGTAVGIQATVNYGTGAITYLYTGLPTGCTSANLSAWVCHPQATGTFTITVTATDELGVAVTRTTTLTVVPAGSSGSSTSGSGLLGNTYFWIAIAVVVAAIIAGVAVALRRRGRSRPPAARTPPPRETYAETSEPQEGVEPAEDER